MKIFDDAYQHKLIYIFEINDDAHRGLLKIGETTIKNPKENLWDIARARIDSYTRTAGISYDLRHVEVAVKDNGQPFHDYDVHRLLKKYRHKFKGSKGREWFKVDLKSAIAAIADVKRGKKILTNTPKENFQPITFRPEQLDAIDLTVKHFKKGKDFLWNAKMRFGKTLCALQVAKKMNFAKTIILTHRPVVNAGWYDDFKKIFHDNDYIYGSKDENYSIEDLLTSGKNFVYFASIQDLRGSEIVGGNFDKNEKIFETDWNFVIVDEAHEGTTTALGDSVIKNIVKDNSKFLALSGTPFNILDDFSGDNVYTWDYIREQRAKADWDKIYFGDPNPYAELPRMNIFTYDLGKNFNYVEDNIFNFREFFRTDGENFVHAADIKSFLDLLVKKDDNNYPYSRADYRELFKHTLWIIPGVKEGKALSELLQRHEVFKYFKIVNVAGNGDSDDEPADALKKVQDAIKNYDYTITLSCGKLTTGVTVPEWTAVFMLAGSYSTSAANYLQTIFRVQSPCTRGDMVKQNCYVFDFAPDRMLKMIAASVAVSARAGKTQDTDRQNLQDLLKFCPVIALDGSEMNYTADNLLQQLKHVYVERVVRNGFADTSLYNDELLKLDELDVENFKNLRGIIGSSDSQKNSGDIIVNDQGLTGNLRTKNKQTRSPAQKELDKQKRRRFDAIKILRGISIRLPLLIYGADVPIDQDFKIEMLLDIVDDDSWAEFMPKGVTKKIFRDFIKYYDPDIFSAAAKKVQTLAKNADDLPPTKRIDEIVKLFATFKNPDKETVLTPWRVVDLHLSLTLADFLTPDKKILEINSKSGLYPLWITQKIYRIRLGNFSEDDFKPEALIKIWDKIVAENIFVVCKTPMAEKITRRTLLGYRVGTVNARHFDDIISILKTNPAKFVESVTDKNFWSKGAGIMKFDGVVGNPPYQTTTANTSDEPVYNYFIDVAFQLADRVSLIHPARCLFNAGKTPKDFNRRLLANEHFRIVKHYFKSQEVFPTSDIKGGVVITEYDATKTFKPIGTFIPFEELIAIHQKVVVDNQKFKPLSEIIYSEMIYHFTKKFHEGNPYAAKLLSAGNENAVTTNIFDKLSKIFLDVEPADGREYVKIYGLSQMNRAFKWIRRDWIAEHDSFDKYKVFLPKSNGSGDFGEVLSNPIIGLPLVGCTQTFITVGAFATRAEAESCLAYIKTKFCRAMLDILKVTQHNPPSKWAKVPLQDFTSASDINWNASIAEIDAQLYRKYKLNDAEIKFIEDNVKAMP